MRETTEDRDPAAVAAEALAMGGLPYYEAVRDGRLEGDPFTVSSGFRIIELALGEVVLAATVPPTAISASGLAHGGWLSALMDLTTGIAVHTHMPPGRYSPHLQASYRFMRPAVPDAALTCRGTVLSLGRRFGTARCELRDEGDRLLATGETTHAIAGEDR